MKCARDLILAAACMALITLVATLFWLDRSSISTVPNPFCPSSDTVNQEAMCK